jgi:hypothetical protein
MVALVPILLLMFFGTQAPESGGIHGVLTQRAVVRSLEAQTLVEMIATSWRQTQQATKRAASGADLTKDHYGPGDDNWEDQLSQAQMGIGSVLCPRDGPSA